MRKNWIYKTLILSLLISVLTGNISVLAQDSVTIGSSTTVGESRVIKSSSKKRIDDLLLKSKPWDGQTISDDGIYALISDMVISSNVSISKNAILLVPQEFTLSVESGKLDNQGEIVGMAVVSGGSMVHSGKIETVAVLSGGLTNSSAIENLMIGGGSAVNRETGKIQTAVTKVGEFNNFGNVKLLEIGENVVVNNQDGGILSEVKVSGGSLLNNANSIIEFVALVGGTITNNGTIDNTNQGGGEITNNSILNDVTVTQGKLMNLHTIEGLTVSGGTVENNGDITDVALNNGEFTNQIKGKISKTKLYGGLLANEGSIDKIKIDGATLENRLDGKLQQTELAVGNFYNMGSAVEVNISGGNLENKGALTKLQIIGGKATNQESSVQEVELIGGEFINNGLTQIARVSRDGIINNGTPESIIKQVIIKNTGTLVNQGDIEQITNNMGEPMYQVAIENNGSGKGSVEADRRNVTNRYVIAGKKLKLSAIPEQGSQFVGWTFSGAIQSSFKDASKAETTAIMPAQDVIITPSFKSGSQNVLGESADFAIQDSQLSEELPGESAK